MISCMVSFLICKWELATIMIEYLKKGIIDQIFPFSALTLDVNVPQDHSCVTLESAFVSHKVQEHNKLVAYNYAGRGNTDLQICSQKHFLAFLFI